MPTSLYRFLNLFKWTSFKDLNFNIYLLHKIILQISKNSKSLPLFKSKLMDCTSHHRFYVRNATILAGTQKKVTKSGKKKFRNKNLAVH